MKLAIKRLTTSDLTFFKWHLKNRHSGSKQKAINLNADTFVGNLYPTLPEYMQERDDKITINLSIYGPGASGEINLTRKIIKGKAYHNWRLNGEVISNPTDAPDRFNILEPSDLLLLDFHGNIAPHAANLLFLSQNDPDDKIIYEGLNLALGKDKMVALNPEYIEKIVAPLDIASTHPIREFLLMRDLEDASQGGTVGASRLLGRSSGRKLTLLEIRQARRGAEEIGRIGEEIIDLHLSSEVREGNLTSFEWSAKENVLLPFDFYIETSPSSYRKPDVKSTRWAFDQPIHISLNELREIADGDKPYDLYRLYEISENQVKLRICRDVRAFGRSIIDALEAMPARVDIDSISVKPSGLDFESQAHHIDVSKLSESEEGEE